VAAATIVAVPSQVPVELPPAVLAFAERGPQWAGFVERLPRVVGGLLDEWELAPDGPATHGFVSVVVPVVAGRVPAMLKVGFPHEESEHEALALQRWSGHGAVRLLRADPHRSALLLERLDPTDLTDTWDLEACEVVAGLYGRLHVPAPPQLRTLTSYVERWTAELSRLPRGAPVPRRLVEQAVALGRDLVGDPASNGVLIHGDLHYENVLASNRVGEDGWLVIDPKPMSGDPHYELAPMLWNRWDEVTASGDVREAVRRRFHALVDAAGLDEGRARDWVVVRMVHNAMWEIEDRPARPDAEYLTRCVAIAKAVQD
jgi:streptomycin 6-kinase